MTETLAETNKQTVLKAYASLVEGNVEGYFERMQPDITITYYGDHIFAGTYNGKQDILERYVPVLLEHLDGPIKIYVTNAIAEGDQVAVEAYGEARHKDGRPYNNKYFMLIEMRDGKIAAVREYMDTQLVKAIFG
ncbi:nuclear transport factor 2 family protein [Streptomyces hyaluromycini]|uniref:Nuclear transport factor 2 family protein n=1 Tax=Streptomyces hyaluromycini TaxID=1377993 RepID=A0ABV1X4J2_9ACTN